MVGRESRLPLQQMFGTHCEGKEEQGAIVVERKAIDEGRETVKQAVVWMDRALGRFGKTHS